MRLQNGRLTPILGMEKYFHAVAAQELPGLRAWAAPCAVTKSTTHGGFDDDEATLTSVIALIKGRSI